ncbi:MAG: hypothetical protein JOZ85_09840 [Betaproteobacteria bacterium]|nr:hypothetical protein [Betaproteobacteria bacterium]
MKRLAIPLSVAALALAACAEPTVQQDRSIVDSNTAPIISQNLPYNTGYGRVESVLFRDGPQSSVSGGTATGASSHPAGTSATDRPEPPVGVPSNSAGRNVRLGIRMDDGTLQYVDTDSDQYPAGTRVLLTSDHTIKKM